MLNYLADLASTLVLGLLTPLTAVCVLPLYPGYLSFLSRLRGDRENKPVLIGLIVTLGVVMFMTLIGLVFTTLLEISLTKIVGIISPIAFGLLGLVSLVLIFDIDIGRFLPKWQAPQSRRPLLSAFLFGFFFGAIVAPCNPGMIAAFFSKSLAGSGLGFLSNMTHFLVFGLGMGLPLIFFSVISTVRSQVIIRFLVTHKSIINRAAGALMLIVSLYYLIFVFRIFG